MVIKEQKYKTSAMMEASLRKHHKMLILSAILDGAFFFILGAVLGLIFLGILHGF